MDAGTWNVAVTIDVVLDHGCSAVASTRFGSQKTTGLPLGAGRDLVLECMLALGVCQPRVYVVPQPGVAWLLLNFGPRPAILALKSLFWSSVILALKSLFWHLLFNFGPKVPILALAL